MGNFFKISYWFNMNPGALTSNMLIAFLIFLLMLLVMFFVCMSMKKSQAGLLYKVYDRLQGFAIGNLIIGLLFLFFTVQLVPVLSSRFWFLVWLIAMIGWIVFITKDIKKIPELKKKRQEEDEFNKYIP